MLLLVSDGDVILKLIWKFLTLEVQVRLFTLTQILMFILCFSYTGMIWLMAQYSLEASHVLEALRDTHRMKINLQVPSS